MVPPVPDKTLAQFFRVCYSMDVLPVSALTQRIDLASPPTVFFRVSGA